MFVYGAGEEWGTVEAAAQIISNKADIPNQCLPAAASLKHTAAPCCFENRGSILTPQSPRRGRECVWKVLPATAAAEHV